ncbi:MAG: hypothetical protein MJB14_09105 [Spirochaetes bacterium]|nr:hypothetical protein [Spirochaetota bacterium]
MSKKEKKIAEDKKVTYIFPKKLHKALKKHCIDEGVSMNEFVIDLVEKALNKHGQEV